MTRRRSPTPNRAATPALRPPPRRWVLPAALVVVAVGVGFLAARLSPTPPGSGRPRPGGADAPPPTSSAPAPGVAAGPLADTSSPAVALRIEVLAARPHDRTAYTQGLLWHDGVLYESTGLRGNSSLREVDPESGKVRRRIEIASDYFAEGLALVGDHLIQLTWKEQVAFVYDRDTFAPVRQLAYTGEGWGLCYDGARLVMSDGSDTLFFRDPVTFAVTGSVVVRRNGLPVDDLNELECVDGRVYANVWLTDLILEIDASTGVVRGVADATGLLDDKDRIAPPGMPAPDVLNGIAYDPTRDVFFITGKQWPRLFEVRFLSGDANAYLPELVKDL